MVQVQPLPPSLMALPLKKKLLFCGFPNASEQKPKYQCSQLGSNHLHIILNPSGPRPDVFWAKVKPILTGANDDIYICRIPYIREGSSNPPPLQQTSVLYTPPPETSNRPPRSQVG